MSSGVSAGDAILDVRRGNDGVSEVVSITYCILSTALRPLRRGGHCAGYDDTPSLSSLPRSRRWSLGDDV